MELKLTFTQKTISNLMTIASAADPLSLMVSREEKQDIMKQVAEQLTEKGKDHEENAD